MTDYITLIINWLPVLPMWAQPIYNCLDTRYDRYQCMMRAIRQLDEFAYKASGCVRFWMFARQFVSEN